MQTFFERGIVKDYILPLVDSVAKDVIDGTSPPDLLGAIGKVVEGRIWDKLKSGPKKLLGYLDDSKTACVCVKVLFILIIQNCWTQSGRENYTRLPKTLLKACWKMNL